MKRPLDYKRDQRAKRDRAALAGLIDSPVTGAITFPANATVYARSVAGSVEGATAATFNGRTVKTPALAAGGRSLIGYIERGTVLTPGPGIEILIDMGMGRYSQIANGEFA